MTFDGIVETWGQLLRSLEVIDLAALAHEDPGMDPVEFGGGSFRFAALGCRRLVRNWVYAPLAPQGHEFSSPVHQCPPGRQVVAWHRRWSDLTRLVFF